MVTGSRWLGVAWWLRAMVVMLVSLQGCNIGVIWEVIWLREHGFMGGLQGIPIALVAIGSCIILLCGGLLSVGVGAYMLMKGIRPRWPAVLLIILALFGFFSMVELRMPGAPEQESQAGVPDTVVAPPDTLSIIRGELEKQYDENRRAFLAKDFDAIMALRTPEFHTVRSDHLVHERAEMERLTRALLDNTERWDKLDHYVKSVTVSGGLATAAVDWESNRTALGSDGLAHRIQRWSTRQETWRRTPEGWKLYRVEKSNELLRIDGRPVPGGTIGENGE